MKQSIDVSGQYMVGQDEEGNPKVIQVDEDGKLLVASGGTSSDPLNVQGTKSPEIDLYYSADFIRTINVLYAWSQAAGNYKRLNVDAGDNLLVKAVSSGTTVNILNAVSTTGVRSVDIPAGKTLTLEIYGTATASTLTFQTTMYSGTPRTIMGVRKSDLETGTSGTIGEIWVFDITGLTTFGTNLTTVTGGNVSIRGAVV